MRVRKILTFLVIVFLITGGYFALLGSQFSFDFGLTSPVTAGSSWTQTSAGDFNAGNATNVTVSSEGNLTLATLTNYLEDNFLSESMVGLKNNVTIDTIAGTAKLSKNYKVYGGINYDYGESVWPTNDGGYIIAGTKYITGFAQSDLWLIKTNSTGDMEWERTFGGSGINYGYSVEQTSDNGYIVTGYTNIYGAAGYNVWLIKTNSTGAEQWNRTFGGSGDDMGYELNITSDGGFIITGSTNSSVLEDDDVWLIKTNSTGVEEWNQTIGGSSDDHGESVRQTSDGGYIITGVTRSYGGGNTDLWLIKTNSTGNETWNTSFGGTLYEWGFSTQETTDGGFMAVGYTYSYGSGGGSGDVWLIKTNSSGNETWNKTYGLTAKNDAGMYGHQTADGGYIITGYSSSYGSGFLDYWLIKTNDTGIVEWHKSYYFGLNKMDTPTCVRQTADGGYVMAGYTNSFSTDNEILWIKTNETGCVPYAIGELTSINLLAGLPTCSMTEFSCDINLAPYTTIKVQFSMDNISWYNSTGVINQWDVLSDGANSINISSLSWSGLNFYYRMNFACENINNHNLSNINLTYNQYLPTGTFESQPFEIDSNISYLTLNWTALVPDNTSIRFQLRSANSQINLTLKNYVGPDGTNATNYTTSESSIWLGHNNDTWIQFICYFNSSNASVSSILEDITIKYNMIPSLPELTGPPSIIWLTDNTPTFTWTFNDTDGTQTDYQVLLDDDIGFGSVDYDSGIVSSTVSTYTPVTQLADGTWNWKVRTKDNDGNWSQYSNSQIVQIDATSPNHFIPGTNPSGWTNNTQPQIIFSTTDDTSGIDHYELKIDTESFSTQSSPYTLPPQSDGMHSITVRAIDTAGNYLDRYIEVFIDTQLPNDFTPIANPGGWSNITQPVISFSTTDTPSGLDQFKVSIDQGSFSNQTSPYTIPIQSDGVHNITVRAIDVAGNYIERYVDIFVDVKPPNSFIPTASPSGWTNNTQPEISFNSTDDTSGIDHFAISIDHEDFSNQTSPYTLPSQSNGMHNITVRAYDLAGNHIESYVDVYIDTLAPKIQHTPVPNSTPNEPIEITAIVTDAHSGLKSVKLYYKQPDNASYKQQLMSLKNGKYSTEIKGYEVTISGLEYYLKAVDKTTPGNIKYFGKTGQVEKQPGPLNDIDIIIEERDITPPTILKYTPTGTKVSIETTITITFNEPMNNSSVESAYSIAPSINGSYSWDGNKFVFTPDNNLEYNMEYTIKIGTNATDLMSNHISTAFLWQFTTISKPKPTTPPEVYHFAPTGMDVPIKTMVTVTFSMSMNITTTESAFSISPSVEFLKFTWKDDDKTVTITFSSDLKYNTKYTITISKDAQDVSNLGLIDAFTFFFNTKSDTDGDNIADDVDTDDDGDGIIDTWELENELDPFDPSDASIDNDNDGLTNLKEYESDTDPKNPDSDYDGLSDGDEVNTHGTKPDDEDSDGDNYKDGLEIEKGSNPNEASSVPKEEEKDEDIGLFGLGSAMDILILIIIFIIIIVILALVMRKKKPEEEFEEEEEELEEE